MRLLIEGIVEALLFVVSSGASLFYTLRHPFATGWILILLFLTRIHSTVLDVFLHSYALQIIDPDFPGPLSIFSSGASLDRCPKLQLSTYDMGIIQIKIIIADRTPATIVKYLNSPLYGWVGANQSDAVHALQGQCTIRAVSNTFVIPQESLTRGTVVFFYFAIVAVLVTRHAFC